MLAHWDEVERGRGETGHLGGEWSNLGSAAGTRKVGLKRIRVDPGKWSTPYHRQTAEEETFYVLAGSGVCLQEQGAFAVGAGDCIVHLAAEPHALRAQAEGLDVLAFGMRGRTEIGHLPRAGVAWLGGTWVDVGGGDHPWEREVAVGEPEVPELGERPANVVNVDEEEGSYGGRWKRLAQAAGSRLTGLNWGVLQAGEEGAPPHCHSADEEIFVVLAGEGWLELWPGPQQVRDGREYEEHPVRAGHVVSRRAGTGISHGIRAGRPGLTYLAYGTRKPDDVCYYPRSNKIYFRGLGLIARLEDLDYDDGEPHP
ncbi:MAG: cupin domain-containing protein [Actinobacteria bacterium]|nr:cupin domain-containing protein [Actinomycetota bacterium]